MQRGGGKTIIGEIEKKSRWGPEVLRGRVGAGYPNPEPGSRGRRMKDRTTQHEGRGKVLRRQSRAAGK